MAAYSTLKGEGAAAAADDVYTTQPCCLALICGARVGGMQQSDAVPPHSC